MGWIAGIYDKLVLQCVICMAKSLMIKAKQDNFKIIILIYIVE